MPFCKNIFKILNCICVTIDQDFRTPWRSGNSWLVSNWVLFGMSNFEGVTIEVWIPLLKWMCSWNSQFVSYIPFQLVYIPLRDIFPQGQTFSESTCSLSFNDAHGCFMLLLLLLFLFCFLRRVFYFKIRLYISIKDWMHFVFNGLFAHYVALMKLDIWINTSILQNCFDFKWHYQFRNWQS